MFISQNLCVKYFQIKYFKSKVWLMPLKLDRLMKIKNICLKRFLTAPAVGPCAVNIMNPEQEAGSGSLFSDQILCLASQLLPQVE